MILPRYSTAGVRPAVSVLSGNWLAVRVVDHAPGVQLASAQRLPGVPIRHSRSMLLAERDSVSATGCSRWSRSDSAPDTVEDSSLPLKTPPLKAPPAVP